MNTKDLLKEDDFSGFFRVSKKLLGEADTKDLFAIYNKDNNKELFICQKPSGYIKDGEKYFCNVDGIKYIGTVKKYDGIFYFTGKTFHPFVLTEESAKELFTAKVIKVFNWECLTGKFNEPTKCDRKTGKRKYGFLRRVK